MSLQLSGSIFISGSMVVSGSIGYTGSLQSSGQSTSDITGSLFGTASYALSASYAPQPNISDLATTGSNTFIGNQIISGSLILTTSGSFILPLTASASPVTGSFYFDFNTNLLYAFNGVSWVSASLS